MAFVRRGRQWSTFILLSLAWAGGVGGPGDSYAGPIGDAMSRAYPGETERSVALRDALRSYHPPGPPQDSEREELLEVVADRALDAGLRGDALRILCERGALASDEAKPAWARGIVRRGLAAIEVEATKSQDGWVAYEFFRALRDHAWVREGVRTGDAGRIFKDKLLNLLLGSADRRQAVAEGSSVVDVLRAVFPNDGFVRLRLLEELRKSAEPMESANEILKNGRSGFRSEILTDLFWITDWKALEADDRRYIVSALMEVVRMRPDRSLVAQRIRETLYVRLGDLALLPETEAALRDRVVVFLEEQYRVVEFEPRTRDDGDSPDRKIAADTVPEASVGLSQNQIVVSGLLERLKRREPPADVERLPAVMKP